ncbi:MAG: hypothetical protein ACE5JX_14680 [Acidobacteriota bacterium]
MVYQIDFDLSKTYDPSAVPELWPSVPVLGTRVVDGAGRKWMFVQAGGAITAKNFLTPDLAEGEHHFRETAAIEEPIEAIADIGCSDNFQFWVCVRGKIENCNVGTPSQGDRLGSTAVAGRADTLTISVTPTQAEIEGVRDAGKRVVALENAAANAADCYIE